MPARRLATPSPSPPTVDAGAVLAASRPLIDVRAPKEFEHGALPAAVNLPILTDDEREAVGIAYKKSGPQAAEALGHDLVSGTIRGERIAAWTTFLREHPNAAVYCARGGLRSRIAQEWMRGAGCDVPRIEGGFKALRRACIDGIERCAKNLSFVVVGGRTGSAKTLLIRAREHIDLEALANHRGSAFGAFDTPQPTAVNFENALAIRLMNCQGTIAIEDESRRIGRLTIPEPLFEAMLGAPIVVVEVPINERIEHIFDEYVQRAPNAQGHLPRALSMIRKRLGNERFARLDRLMTEAFEKDDDDAHRAWIRGLLEDYYDPMYDYQLTGKEDRIALRGNSHTIRTYLESLDD